MQILSSGRRVLGVGTAMATLLAVMSVQASAADRNSHLLPPLSVRTARYFASHPDAYARFLAQLAPGPNTGAKASTPRFATTTGGTWTLVTKAPGYLTNALLLTDGTVLAASGGTPNWYKLTPDSSGNYAKGTWTTVATLPVENKVQYAPLYHASAVLPDGRVIIEGGEYNGNSAVWTNDGAIYDPIANTWTSVYPPFASAWSQIGDAQSVVLPSGVFMLATCCAYNPPADALLNPKALTWAGAPAPNSGGQLRYQDEQGYELLPNGDVLTIDVWGNYPAGNPTTAERYNPYTRKWGSAGNTPVSLVDPTACGNYEIGPAVLRGDGTVVAFGGNTGCVAGATVDPTAIYKSGANTWSAGPDVPSICGSDGATACDLADAPGALLPDGNILFAASAGYGGNPTHFFEFTSTNTINQVSDPLKNAATNPAFAYDFLSLPNGQILMTDFTRDAEVYTPSGTPLKPLAPVIISVPTTVTTGKTYEIVGKQLGGRTQGSYYGDDAQMATNYPVIRITNTASGHVFYGRTTGFSNMSVTPNILGSANFTLPTGIETGASTLEAVASGVASAPVAVTVK